MLKCQYQYCLKCAVTRLSVHQGGYICLWKGTPVASAELYRKAGFEYLGDYDVYIIRDIQSTEI